MCVLCVCPTWDIRNGRSYRHAAYNILKSLVWRLAQTAFRAYTLGDWREKAFEMSSPVARPIPYAHRYTSGCPEQDESCPLHQSRWNILEGYALKDTPPHHTNHSYYCFLREWAIDTSPYGSWLLDKETNPFVNGLRPVLYKIRVICVGVCVCVSVCVCLSNLRYPEREIVSPRCLHHLENLRLASCTKCFRAYTTPGVTVIWYPRYQITSDLVPPGTKSLSAEQTRRSHIVYMAATKKGYAISAPSSRKTTSKRPSSTKHVCPICEDVIVDQSSGP